MFLTNERALSSPKSMSHLRRAMYLFIFNLRIKALILSKNIEMNCCSFLRLVLRQRAYHIIIQKLLPIFEKTLYF